MFGAKYVVCISLLLPVTILEVWVFSRPAPQRIKALRMHIYFALSVVMFICSKYIWKRLNILVHNKSLFHFGALLKILTFTLLIIAQVAIVCIVLVVQTDPPLFSYIATFSLGSVMLLSFSMIIADIFSFLCRRILCRKSRIINSLDKTEIKIRSLLSLIGALILILAGSIGVNYLAIEQVTVPITGLDPKLNGTTIIQISDIHLGPFNGRSRLEAITKKVNILQGDIVVITGDLVDSSVAALQEAVMPLKKMKAKYGVFYITGNHEYYTGDVDNWLIELPKLNVTPLVNQRVCLLSSKSSCKEGIYLAGLEDLEARIIRYGAHSMDIHSALSGRTPGVPTVVLAHQPKAAAEAIMWNDVRLVLSGHTHAGQILPMMLFAYLYNPFYVGLYQPRHEVYVYVNPGTVYFFVPFRHYRPEITLLTLISQK